jgi:pyrroloquinoline quinone (PQQ) biosynthesis protein C
MFFEDLQRATAAERARLEAAPVIQGALAGQATRQQYVGFLFQAYHHVRHTVPLLMACGARLSDRHAWLREAMVHYIDEEKGHEEWILDDLRACGADAETVRNGTPALPTELMVAYAYDTIARRNPVGFLGMVHVLEGTSIRLATTAAATLRRSLGLPKTAFTYLDSHGSLDLQHVEFFRGLANRLDSPEDRASVLHCAKVVYRLYGDIFLSLQGTQ